jgi:hypothetical protein
MQSPRTFLWRRNPFVIAFAALTAGKGKGFGLQTLLVAENRGVAQSGSAFGSGPKGRRFKSSRPDRDNFSGPFAEIPVCNSHSGQRAGRRHSRRYCRGTGSSLGVRGPCSRGMHGVPGCGRGDLGWPAWRSLVALAWASRGGSCRGATAGQGRHTRRDRWPDRGRGGCRRPASGPSKRESSGAGGWPEVGGQVPLPPARRCADG